MRVEAEPVARSVRRWLLALLAVGLLARLAALACTSDLGIRIVDEAHYHTLATSLVEGRGFAFENGPTSIRPPLYPAFVAAVWAVTGTRSLQAVRAVQIGLALMTTLLVFGLGRDLFGQQAGLAAATLACFYPSLLVSNYLLLTEVLFATLVAAATWAIVRVGFIVAAQFVSLEGLEFPYFVALVGAATLKLLPSELSVVDMVRAPGSYGAPFMPAMPPRADTPK